MRVPRCKCGHGLFMHDGSSGRKYCKVNDCKCSKFEYKGFTSALELPDIHITLLPDDDLYSIITAFLLELCELGFGYLNNNSTEGESIPHNIYQAFIEEPHHFIKATTFKDIIKSEKKEGEWIGI